jgi:hypothetical protein
MDTSDSDGWQPCEACRGLGALFTKPADAIEARRSRVLAAYPAAAAGSVPDFFVGPLAFGGAAQAVVNLSKPLSGPDHRCPTVSAVSANTIPPRAR